ncbi:MAG: hypothetical protein COB37_11550 [Kordiimonadales bacterium]|nr:MAG: hypothetical protein COB37_11550 [Kordiimonadales bacterium]
MKLGETLRQLLTGQPRTDNSETMLHRGWEQRDDGIYPDLFGPAEGPPVMLTEKLFHEDFGRKNIHPFWLHHGVITFPPTETRPTWLYATSGMSNAFDSVVEEWSGLGVEFLMETHEKADWAAEALAWLMAFNLLIAIGHFDDMEAAALGGTIPMNAPLNAETECALTGVLALTPTAHQTAITMVTGKAELLQLVGISEDEAAYIQENGHEAFAAKIAASPQGLITDPSRALLV